MEETGGTTDSECRAGSEGEREGKGKMGFEKRKRIKRRKERK